MSEQLTVAEVTIAVVRKDIAHTHLHVHPPDGRVQISAPSAARLSALRALAIQKLPWIRAQRAAMLAQERETPRAYVPRESHQVWGRRRLLELREADVPPRVEVHPRTLVLTVRPGTPPENRATVLQAWYRDEVRRAVGVLMPRWEKALGVRVLGVQVRTMKTLWGACTPTRGTIRLNTDLARKPRECLDYILLHEIAHLRVPHHGPAFIALLDRHLPAWRHHRDQLGRLPLAATAWDH